MEDYVPVGKIGDGAQGSVFQVSKKDNGAVYALKVIYCSGQKQVNAAIKEVKCLVALRHANIVSYEDFFLQLNVKALKSELGVPDTVDDSHDSVFNSLYAAKQQPLSQSQGSMNDSALSSQKNFGSEYSTDVGVCLIMELCSNGDLHGVIGAMREKYMDTGRHPVNEETITSWIRQCASALEYIHGKGFIHRDVKPLNVFFDAQGNIKLGDFGVAATVGLGCHSAVGTPDYLAPERMLQEVYDEKVDIWGLGMVALEAITLTSLPMNSRVLDNPNTVDKVVGLIEKMGFSTSLGELVRSMLQRQPSERPSATYILKCLPTPLSHPAVVQGPVLRPRNVNSTSDICCICEVETATHSCSECNHLFCKACDKARHKHPSRRAHQRVKINVTSSSSHPLTDHQASFPLTPKKIIVPIVPRNQANRRTICVPADCSSLMEALALAASTSIENITVNSGYVCKEPLVFTEKLLHSVSIIGENPPPVIDVDHESFAVHFASGSGSLVNFSIRHSGKRESTMSTQKGQKPPRPTVFRVSGGQWQLLNCSVSCKEGSGVIISNDEQSRRTAHITIHGCTFCDIRSAAIIFGENTAGVVEKNSFQRCGYAALVLKDSSNPKIVMNTIRECSQMGIMCDDANGVIESNEITNNRESGVVLKGARTRSLLLKNTISENQMGIICADYCQPSLYENYISANQKAGIIVKGGAYPTVKRNTIADGGEAGIYVLDYGKGLFSENQILSNRNAGVLVTTHGFPEVVQNSIQGNAEGVWVCNDGAGTFLRNVLDSNRNGSKDIQKCCEVIWENNTEQ